MSGFSAAWLALREPADHAARDPGLVAALGRALSGRALAGRNLAVVDLGCGTGSNLRALGPHLPARQEWCLVDHDPALLDAAREELAAWADAARPEGDALVLHRAGRRIAVRFRALDLAGGLTAALAPAPDLVTAAALFDLVSEDRIGAAARAVAAAGAAFYAALNYDGREAWQPPHPGDAAIHAAFLAHQGRDKGLGPAAGPGAAAILARAFGGLGYAVRLADSPWRLGPGGGLIGALAAGTARAAAETGLVPAREAASWRAARLEPGTRVLVGHTDVLALPPAP
ncbi:hypothetical protein OPKNFCMD_0423 [Methylobacterium crusticola]|uniref:Methyltransferase type 12 domain-containing protein n=1 Tax=Methylobacterium crusticola TaxID=1697972 RepID=A0ABQ4QR08_9HYPH|nr:class I SAM-dependent methyltransferase [Methylobacterium crusticola]GJD47713.1 hypothetical protein OPKNFCMD_0423 [Methylobacterium crusticola]